MDIPRKEHPKPQFERAAWMNLNGTWDFEIDNGRSGQARGMFAPEAKLAGKITVPFCPQSRLSGLEHKDFLYGVWYQRKFTLSQREIESRTVLHVGAADYQILTFVWT